MSTGIEALSGMTQLADSSDTALQKAASNVAGGELGQNQFMTLLVTQLRNQDPLKPMDNAEFISQLATFSSLEKLTSIESILKSRLAAPAAKPATEATPFPQSI